jgi:DNA-binding MarR family transcriptional regulator
MALDITPAEYRALAELRYRIRHFLREGDAKARAVGLEPQQYLMLLAIRGLPEGSEATIQTLAERLALKHHSAVELIDRLETHGYVRRTRSRDDRRRVFVTLLPRGERTGEALVGAIEALLDRGRDAGNNLKKTNKREVSVKRARR